MTERVGQQMGNYQLIRLLGEGGFAEVYLGEHIHLGTQAAIKVLHTQITSDDIDKFRTEARTVARLIHPNIVRVLEFGVEGKTPFLVMDYAVNGTLRQRHQRGIQLPLATVVNYVRQVAEALQYAHEERLIHRDIKPENMLLGRRNEILLSDFGIALVAQSSRYQNTQEVAGTVAYMSPEQIQGKPRPASDQYSLAVVVYEWLTKDRPFHGSFTEIATQHVLALPTPLREKDPTISPDVEQVVMTALAKDPKGRFGSIQAFANALEQASQMDTPTFVNALAPTILPTRLVPLSGPRHENPVTPPLFPTQPIIISKDTGTIRHTFSNYIGGVKAVAWSPDGQHLATAGDDNLVRVLDASNGAEALIYRGHNRGVKVVVWSPEGERLATAGDDKVVRVLLMATGRESFIYRGHDLSVNALAWSPDGMHIASASSDYSVRIWNTVSGKSKFTYHEHSGWVAAVGWSPDGKLIASGGQDTVVQVWDAATANHVFTCRNHLTGLYAIAWSPDGKLIASTSQDGVVRVWHALTGNKIVSYRGHFGPVYSVAWSPDGKLIASGGKDKTIQVWNGMNGSRVFAYEKHSGPINAVVWSPDGRYIASASDDKTVQVWSAP